MRRTRAAAAMVVVGLVVGLSGCSGGDGGDGAQEPAAESPAQESSSTSTTSTVDPATDCLSGQWLLDNADYEAQAIAYMTGLGIPVESLTIGGEQVVEFQDRGVMAVRTDLVLDAVVYGIPLSVTSQSSGNGEWSIGDGGLQVENWIWGVEPAPVGAGAPSVPLFDPSSGSTTADCGGDFLALRGADAPLVGNFVRL